MAQSPFKANVSFAGQIPFLSPTGDEDRSDYRPVPETDRGNSWYRDRGALGSYPGNAEPFDAPADVRWSAGYGATEADLKRGFLDPLITEQPAYDLGDYKDRSTLPRISDDDDGGASLEDDYAFRRRNERSRGFMTRPRIPTER